MDDDKKLEEKMDIKEENGNEEKDLSPQFQSDSNILSPFINDLAFDSSRFYKRQSFTFLPKQKQTDFYKFSVLQKNIWL